MLFQQQLVFHLRTMNHSHKHNLFSPFQSSPLPSEGGMDEAQLKLEEETCWRTNLMLGEEEERVQQRNALCPRRTSFEENLLNDHLQAMKSILEDTGLKTTQASLPSSDRPFSEIRESGQLDIVESNCYLLEEQKWELREIVLGNHENFSILLRLSPLFLENKEELVYILCKILHYVSTQVKCTPHQRKKPDPHLLIEAHKLKLVEAILSQQNIAVMTPDFFSNQNEEPLMAIILVWLHAVLCIKNGIYSEQGMEIEEQEDNFFD